MSTPDILEIARSTGLRSYLHGVNAQDARAMLQAFLAAVAAAPAVPKGVALVPTPITEDMHVAACKVLHRALGLDGLPQRMLDAMIAAAPAAH